MLRQSFFGLFDNNLKKEEALFLLDEIVIVNDKTNNNNNALSSNIRNKKLEQKFLHSINRFKQNYTEIYQRINALESNLQEKRTSLVELKKITDDSKRVVTFLEENIPNFIERHPWITLGYIASVLLAGLSIYSFYKIAKFESEIEHDALNQFRETLAANTTIPCGEVIFPSEICDESYRFDPSYKEDIYFYCVSLLNDLCSKVQTEANNQVWLVGAILGSLGTIGTGGFSIIGTGFDKCKKDNRQYSKFTQGEKAIVENIFIALGIERMPQDQDKIYNLIEMINEKIMELANNISSLENDVMADQNKLAISKNYNKAVCMFYNPKQDDKNKPEFVSKLPTELKQYILSFVDPEKDIPSDQHQNNMRLK